MPSSGPTNQSRGNTPSKARNSFCCHCLASHHGSKTDGIGVQGGPNAIRVGPSTLELLEDALTVENASGVCF